jgi:hypothetical protein
MDSGAMPKIMRTDMLQPGTLRSDSQAALDALHRPARPFDHVVRQSALAGLLEGSASGPQHGDYGASFVGSGKCRITEVDPACLEIATLPPQSKQRTISSSSRVSQDSVEADVGEVCVIEKGADLLSGEVSLSGAGLGRSFDVRGTGYQSLLLGPSEDHSEMSKLGMNSSVSNTGGPSLLGVRATIANHDGVTICSGKTRT